MKVTVKLLAEILQGFMSDGHGDDLVAVDWPSNHVVTDFTTSAKDGKNYFVLIVSEERAYSYHVTPAHAGYGARIWLPEDNISTNVWNFMNRKSKWGGIDKSMDRLDSWEFADNDFKEACAFLEAYGYELKEMP